MLSGRLFGAAKRASALALLGAVASSCSLLIDKNADQCEANSDCTKFAGTTCQENVCIAAPCQTLADCSAFPDTICKSQTCQPIGDGCQTNQECIDKNGEYNVCRKDIGACVALESPLCSTVLGNWKDDNAFLFGAIFPLSGDDTKTGEALRDSVELAINDFATRQRPLPAGAREEPSQQARSRSSPASTRATAPPARRRRRSTSSTTSASRRSSARPSAASPSTSRRT